MNNKTLCLIGRALAITFFGLLSFHQCFSQIVVQKFPIDNQVLQRDDNDEAEVSVAVHISTVDRISVVLKIWKDGALFFEKETIMTGQQLISFTPKIKAGQNNYTVRLYIGGHETKKAERVVAGDIILVYGQSNAMGYSGNEEYRPVRNVFTRFFIMNNYEQGTGEWLVPFETFRWAGVGLLPLELQRLLLEKHKYPIGLIIGAEGGASITLLNERTADNPTNIHNIYGRMMAQVRSGSNYEQIKYMIFRHGETDAAAYDAADAYPNQFKKLLDNLNTDLPNLRKIFNSQANILEMINPKAAFIREFQRNSEYMSPFISIVSTVGTRGYDGVHYTFEGTQQSARELSRIISKEVYKENQPAEIYSPNLKKAYWDANQLVLEFDESMTMKYPADTSINGWQWRMKDYIYIDDKSGLITSGTARGNKIYLNVTTKGTVVSYLPAYYGNQNGNPPFYNGTHFTNSMGMRAFSFDKVPIKENASTENSDLEPLSISINLLPKCAGEQAEVNFTTRWQNTGMHFKVQLSDKNGGFASNNIIGQGTTSPILTKFPDNLEAGDGYRIRFMAGDKTNNLETDALVVQLKTTVNVSTKTPLITLGEEANIHLQFTGTPPFDFVLSDSTRHKVSSYNVDFIKRPRESITYSVLSLDNVCGNGKVAGQAAIEVVKVILANEPANPNIISIFPNPTTDYFIVNIDSKSQAEFRLYDASGRIIEETTFHEQMKVSAANLSGGVYFYQIKNGRSVNTGKIIVQ